MSEKTIASQECRDCGVCCQHTGWPPFSLGERNWETCEWDEYERLPSGARKAHFDAYRDQLNNWGRPCTWYDHKSGGCRWYNYRPRLCREFEAGGEDCLRLRHSVIV